MIDYFVTVKALDEEAFVKELKDSTGGKIGIEIFDDSQE
jgi:TRAP-type C4-dicarboxylate transport system substrate-binding protein